MQPHTSHVNVIWFTVAIYASLDSAKSLLVKTDIFSSTESTDRLKKVSMAATIMSFNYSGKIKCYGERDDPAQTNTETQIPKMGNPLKTTPKRSGSSKALKNHEQRLHHPTKDKNFTNEPQYGHHRSLLKQLTI